jgi:hypothetical protein
MMDARELMLMKCLPWYRVIHLKWHLEFLETGSFERNVGASLVPISNIPWLFGKLATNV